MNDTTTTSAEQAIKDELRRLGWMIPDAQRRLNEHAQTMLRRAERAVSLVIRGNLLDGLGRGGSAFGS